MMDAKPEIQRIVQQLTGKNVTTIVASVDELLVVAEAVGTLHCTSAGEDTLSFTLGEQPPFETALDHGRMKLRVMCARLAVLCQQSGCPEVSPYGGRGVIKKATPNRANGQPLASDTSRIATLAKNEWTVDFKNTPSEQEFTIVA